MDGFCDLCGWDDAPSLRQGADGLSYCDPCNPANYATEREWLSYCEHICPVDGESSHDAARTWDRVCADLWERRGVVTM